LCWGSYAARLRAYHAKNKAHLRTVLRREQGAALPVAILVDLATHGFQAAPGTGPKAGLVAVGHEQSSEDAIWVEVNLPMLAFDDRLSILSPANAQAVLSAKMV